MVETSRQSKTTGKDTQPGTANRISDILITKQAEKPDETKQPETPPQEEVPQPQSASPHAIEPVSDQAQQENKVAQQLLVRLKQAVQSSDDPLAACLLAELYARFEQRLHASISAIQGKDRGSLSAADRAEIIHATLLHILLQMLTDYEESTLYGIARVLLTCRSITSQRLREKTQDQASARSVLPDAATVSDEGDVHHLVLNQEREQVMKPSIEHPSAEEPVEQAGQAVSDDFLVEATPYIVAKAEQIMREARLRSLEKQHQLDVQSALPVKEAEAASPPIPIVEEVKKPVKPPLLKLHKRLEEVKAYEKIKNKKHRQVLEEYLKTEKPMGDLKDMAGVKTVDAVNHIVHRNLNKVFAELKPEVQAQFGGSANEAIKLKVSEQLKTDLTSKRIKKGIDEKRTNSEDYRQHLSAGMSRRWQHYREIDRPQGKPPFSEQGLENIRQRGRNIPRENMSKAARRRWEKYREQQFQDTTMQEPPSTPAPKEHTIVDLTKSSQ